MKTVPSASPASWKQRYENLRSHVFEGHQRLGADPLGLVLLYRQGLASWMLGWEEVAGSRPPFPIAASTMLSPMTPLWQQQLTALLAQMTAQHLL